jgi:hypothetical protein
MLEHGCFKPLIELRLWSVEVERDIADHGTTEADEFSGFTKRGPTAATRHRVAYGYSGF